MTVGQILALGLLILLGIGMAIFIAYRWFFLAWAGVKCVSKGLGILKIKVSREKKDK